MDSYILCDNRRNDNQDSDHTTNWNKDPSDHSIGSRILVTGGCVIVARSNTVVGQSNHHKGVELRSRV